MKRTDQRTIDEGKDETSQMMALWERQTEQERADLRAEFEATWPALAAYVKQTEARGARMEPEVIGALVAADGGPPPETLGWYTTDLICRSNPE